MHCLPPSPASARRAFITVVLSVVLQPIKTSPTGFSLVPPDGPAMPVVEIPISAPASRRTPCAICAAVCMDTAPYCESVFASTCKSCSFIWFAYAQIPQSNTEDAPGTEVIFSQISPPVQLSAAAILQPLCFSADTSIGASCASVRLLPVSKV